MPPTVSQDHSPASRLEVIAQIIGGEHGQILIRQKAGERIELGDLLVADDPTDPGSSMLLQVHNLRYGSQENDLNLQLMSGMQLELHEGGDFLEPQLRSYVLAEVTSLLVIERGAQGHSRSRRPKHLPSFFRDLRRVRPSDLDVLTQPAHPVFLGYLRSGSRTIPQVRVAIDGVDMFTHHVLVPATTGRGKSNLMKVMLWSTLGKDYCGLLVLDPHDEYYGREGHGLKDHPDAPESLVYYSPDPPRGSPALRINLRRIRPDHLRGIVPMTEAQGQAAWTLWHHHRDAWLAALLLGQEEEFSQLDIGGATIGALRRKLRLALGVRTNEGQVVSRNEVFTTEGGDSTLSDIVEHLQNGRKVIVDTSRLSDSAELLIGSIVAGEVFRNYQGFKAAGRLRAMPVISFVIEEAPRVLGGGSEEPNIFGTIAREGRKFRIGLVAITQLCSLIPREIMANLNTKVILGNEMAAEREAIISSASQDLTRDSQLIAGLDRGEAIVSSVFTKFAIPIQVPFFDELVAQELLHRPPKRPPAFLG